MTGMLPWFFVALAVERLVEIILTMLPALQKGKPFGIDVGLLLAFAFSLILAYGVPLDVFDLVGFSPQWVWLGPFVSALFLTGGSNMLHDLAEWLKATKEHSKSKMF